MLHFETWIWNYVHGVDSIMKNENKRTFQGGHNNIKIVVCKYREFEWNTGNMGLLRWPLVVKNLPANKGDVRDMGSIPGSGRSPGGGHGNPLQYSCLENPMDREAWQDTPHGVAQSWTRLNRLGTQTPKKLLGEQLNVVTPWFPAVSRGQFSCLNFNPKSNGFHSISLLSHASYFGSFSP